MSSIMQLLRYLYYYLIKYGVDLKTIVITILGIEKTYSKYNETGYEIVSVTDNRFEPFNDAIIGDMGGRYGR